MTALLSQRLVEQGPFDYVPYYPDSARLVWQDFRELHGFTSQAEYTQSGKRNHKTAKSAVETRTLTLLPWTGSGEWNVCQNATAECRANCNLVTAGKSRMPAVQRGRRVRTLFLGEYPDLAVVLIADEIRRAVQKYDDVLVRLNTASDLHWERIAPSLFDIEGARYYDYTKIAPSARGRHPNYRLVYSLSEAPHSIATALDYLEEGGTVAVVFDTKRGEALPPQYLGYPVIDGDTHDDRTLDPEGVIVGLRAKGSARSLRTGGFVKSGHGGV